MSSKPLIACGHPAVIRILDQILPGKRVMDFSLHFHMDQVSTVTAEIQLTEEDAEEIARVVKEYRLEAGDPLSKTSQDDDGEVEVHTTPITYRKLEPPNAFS